METTRTVLRQPLKRGLVVCLIAAGMLLPTAAQSATATRSSAFAYDADGYLTKEIVEPNDSSLCLVKEYTYDSFGNQASVTTRNCNGSSGEAPAPTGDAVFSSRTDTVSYTYNADGTATTVAKNALGHTETKVFEASYGNLVSLTGPNGLPTGWNFDTFGRVIQETRADATTTQYGYYQPCDLANANLGNAVYCVRTVSTGSSRATRAYFDSLDRNLTTTRIDFTNTAWIDDGRVDYDAFGRVARSYLPYKRGLFSSAKYATFGYDELNRVKTETAPDGSITTQTYSGLTVTTTNALGQAKTVTRNSQGQNIIVTDAANKSLHYVYDPFGNLTHTIDSQGNTIVLTYDARGRKTGMSDPDMGVWSYAYNAIGELIRQTDAKGQVTTIQYDVLGRMTTRIEADLTSTWVYDTAVKGIGKLAQATADNGYSRVQTYDASGRPDTTSTIVDNAAAPYVTKVAYDAAGRVDVQTYPASGTHPAGFAVKNIYDVNGYLQKVVNAATTTTVYWQANVIDEMNRVRQQTYGNGVVVTQVYDEATGRILQQLAGAGNGVQSMTYTYDTLGNLQTRIDANSNLLETFAYDNLNRVNIATTISGTVNQVSIFDYDELGNIVSKTGVGSYTYNASGANSIRPHAVTSITGSVNGVVNPSFSYDSNGNMVSGAGRTVVWNSFNMPAQITNGTKTSSFWYNPEHERTKELQTDGSIVITLSPRYDTGLHFEKRQLATNGVLNGSVEYEHYLYAGGSMFGKYVTINDAAGVTTLTKVEYYHKDHLGSIVAITDGTGAVTQRMSYDVWGKRRKPDGAVDPNLYADMYHGYTGHEMIEELNLIHMNGRLYDQTLSRFVSSDIYIQDPLNLQSFNRYAYVWNNPLTGMDPSGFVSCDGTNEMSCLDEYFSSVKYGVNPNVVPVGANPAEYDTRASVENGTLVITTKHEAISLTDFSTRDYYGNPGEIPGGSGGASRYIQSLDWSSNINSAEQAMAEWAVKHPSWEIPVIGMIGMAEAFVPTSIIEAIPFGKMVSKVGKLGGVAKEAAPLWSATRSKSAVENALGHWNKHGAEFPELANSKQYVEAARSLAVNPPADALIKFRGADTLVYDKVTNTFLVKGADGAPRTMFRPTDGIDYWNKQ